MEPVTVIAAAAALSSLAQLYTGEKARKATREQLDKIEDMFNKIKPPDYDLTIHDPPALHKEALSLPKYSSPVAAPKFGFDKLTPEEFKVIGKYAPEAAPYIAEVNPTLIEKTSDMKAGRDAQLAALKRYDQIGKGEFDPEYAQAIQSAARRAQAEAQSRQASIMQDFARRGMAGSGLNLAAQMGSSAQAMDRAAMVNQAAATDAYRNRLNALASGAALGAQIQGQDMDLQSRNASIINDFNQRMSRQRQALEDQRVAAINQAQMYNLGVSQDIANRNVDARNLAQRADRDRLDELAKFGYSAARDEADRADRNSQQSFLNRQAERNRLDQILAGEAAWKAGERDKLNQIRSNAYQDKLDIARGIAGVGSQRMQNDMSAARDRNALIQGLSNTAMTAAMVQGNRSDADRDYELRKKQYDLDEQFYKNKYGA